MSGPQYSNLDLVCFSHLRWDFVFQRPQHILSRFARKRRVFFVEEPIVADKLSAHLDVTEPTDNLWRIVPRLPAGLNAEQTSNEIGKLLETFFEQRKVGHPIFWYYTPMALPIADKFSPLLSVYDCMDELSNFKNAPASLKNAERELFDKVDLVFTGGRSLYEAKRGQHSNVQLFPSSVDIKHFGLARTPLEEPADQAEIPHPRIGFAGVIDERMDLPLLKGLSEINPDWHFVMLGPVVKIDPGSLPQGKNIHYLGLKSYAELPNYIAGWEVSFLPFARNAATQFISPTKTPEYLSAGKKVVSTSIRDVVSPYSALGLVEIGDSPAEVSDCIQRCLECPPNEKWLGVVDRYLSTNSWDATWQQMDRSMGTAYAMRKKAFAA